MFDVLAVYQAMLPLLRESSDARIVNVSSAVGSLTANADPAYPYHPMFGPVYPASKAALNAITLAMMVELESTGIKVNLVSPGFTKTNLNGYEGTQSVEEGSREVVRVALLGPDGPTGTFTRWEKQQFRGDGRQNVRGPSTRSRDLDHLFAAGGWSITAAPALLTTSSCESVPPEQPIAPIILPCSISGMPPRDAMIPSNASR